VRAYFVGVPVAAFLATLPTAAYAPSACAAWIDFSGTQDSCYEMIDDWTRSAGFKGRRVEETFFFWFGSNVVTARCITEKGLIAFAAYHRDNHPAACVLSDRIRNVIERRAAGH
jgi:hypothetical protein